MTALASLAAGAAFGLCLATGGAVEAISASASQSHPPGIAPARFEPGEEFPGGQATSKKSTDNSNAFSNASGNIGFTRKLDFTVGNGIFKKLWISAPSSTSSSDGLGPLFNARSCQRCHLKDGRGHTPRANWPDDDAVSMFLRLSVPATTDAQKRALAEGRVTVVPEPVYGGQLQDLAIQGHDGEGRMHIDYEDVPVALGDGEKLTLRKPSYSITDLKYGALDPEVMMSPRIAPQMIGMGLLEAVPEAEIAERADPDDRDGDGISGRPNRVWSMQARALALGRFGWKAGMPDIRQQTASAFAGDIGISTSMVRQPSGDCTGAQALCMGAPNGNSESAQGSEAGDQFLDLVVFYAQNLAVPKRRKAGDPEILKGKALFHATGCAACHRPKLTTGKSPATGKPNPHLENQTIWPYTDLLLHDMGDGLADNRPEGAASGREWRTAPLWGIGLTETVNGHEFMLHDGRARGVKEAILWHGGEAQRARDAFAALARADRERLIAFVKSL